MVRYKVKFDDEGRKCPDNISMLKRKPECGIYFVEDMPFNPHNKPPKTNPYVGINRNFTIDVFGNNIPPQPERPTPEIPRGRGLTIGQQPSPFVSDELAQDETNVIVQGNRNVLENLQYRRTGGYAAVPINNDLSEPVVDINNIQYNNQEEDTLLTRTAQEVGELFEGTELTQVRPRQEGEIIQSRILPERKPMNIRDLPDDILSRILNETGGYPHSQNEIDEYERMLLEDEQYVQEMEEVFQEESQFYLERHGRLPGPNDIVRFIRRTDDFPDGVLTENTLSKAKNSIQAGKEKLERFRNRLRQYRTAREIMPSLPEPPPSPPGVEDLMEGLTLEEPIKITDLPPEILTNIASMPEAGKTRFTELFEYIKQNFKKSMDARDNLRIHYDDLADYGIVDPDYDVEGDEKFVEEYDKIKEEFDKIIEQNKDYTRARQVFRDLPEPPPSPPGEEPRRGKKPMRKNVVDKIKSLFRRRRKAGKAGTSTEEPPITQEQLETELQQLNITDLPPDIIEEIVQTEINTPIKTINEQIREVKESMDLFGESILQGEEYIDLLEYMVEEVETLFENEPNDENALLLEEKERELAEAKAENEIAKKEFANSERRYNELNNMLERIEQLKTIFPEIPEPPPSPPGEAGPSRDIPEEELREIQMEDFRRAQQIEELAIIDPAREEEVILDMAEDFIRPDKPKLTFNDVKKILNKVVKRVVAPERVYDILNENDLYDAYYEDEFRKIQPEDREFARRFQKQNVSRAKEIEMQDTNLVPEKAVAPFEPLQIEEYTPAIDRPGEEFKPRPRGKIQKALQKAGNLVLSEEQQLGLKNLINKKPPRVAPEPSFDEEFIGEFRQVQLTEAVRPSLSLGERITQLRTTTTRAEVGKAGAGLGVGLAAGYASAELFKDIGIDNPALLGFGTGAVAGGATGLTTYALERAAGKVAVGATRSALTGIAEGGIFGLATVPADMALNSYLVKKQGMSHTAANVISTTATAGTLTGVIIGASLAGVVETGGASLVAGAVALGVGELISLFSGISEDKKERERQEEIRTIQSTNIARQKLLASLPKYNYDYTKAFKRFKDKDKLGMDRPDWKPFMMKAFKIFNPSDWSNKKLPPSDPSKEPTGDDKLLAHYMSRYITRKLIERTCANVVCSEETKRNMPEELDEKDIEWMKDKTANTWQDIADVTVEQAYQENQLTNKRVEEARKIVINRWSQSKELPESLEPQTLAYANLDGKWLDSYKNYINGEAENFAIDAYNNNQTKQGQLPKYIRDALAYNPDSVVSLNNYYKHIEEASQAINVSPGQFIDLQKAPYYERKKLYDKYQFEAKQADPKAVEEAGKIATMEDKVKEGGYYDVDEAILKTDPTSITTWKPSDSQIFQAHAVGMTLQEYVNYMHELAKGEDGNFDNLPVLTNAQISILGFDDFDQFLSEVELAGLDPNAYQYDSQTKVISMKPITSIPINEEDIIEDGTNDRQLHEEEENNVINSVVSDMFHNLDLDRISNIQNNVEQTHREIAVDTNLNRPTMEGYDMPNVPVAVA